MDPGMKLATYLVLLATFAGSSVLATRNLSERSSEKEPQAEGSVNIALATRPKSPLAGEPATLEFLLTDESGQPVEDVQTYHDRKLHVVIVSEDMRIFGHVHPEDFDAPLAGGRANVFFTFPRAGRYLAAVDIVAADRAQAEQFEIVVGEGGVAESAPPTPAGMAVVEVEEDDRHTAPIILDEPGRSHGFEVSVIRPDPIDAAVPATIAWRVTKDDLPVTDLRLFLDAPMHLAVVKDDFSHFQHGHGMAMPIGIVYDTQEDHQHGTSGLDAVVHDYSDLEYFGPEITATLTFPDPGRYYVFGQAAHGTSFLLTRIPVEAR